MNAKQLQIKRRAYFTTIKNYTNELYNQEATEERRAEAIDLLELLADNIHHAKETLIKTTILTYANKTQKQEALTSLELHQALKDSQATIDTIERLIANTRLTEQEAIYKYRLHQLNNGAEE
jgi:hypothetical protein